jgi:glycosyltransferase involved in cell wall biosynthesis
VVLAEPAEIIAVNDGSTDGTLIILLELQSELANLTVLSCPNRGESSAINAGLEASSCPYVLFLSADDLISPDLLFKAKLILDSNQEVIAVYPQNSLVNLNGLEIGTGPSEPFRLERLLGALECALGVGSVLRRDCISEGRVETMRLIPDLEQWLRLSKRGNFVHLPEKLAAWRLHSSNMHKRASGRPLSIELDYLREVALDAISNQYSGEELKIMRLWFLASWNRRKAIAEATVNGSFLSIRHAWLSVFFALKSGKSLAQDVSWTSLEFVGANFPWFVRQVRRHQKKPFSDKAVI